MASRGPQDVPTLCLIMCHVLYVINYEIKQLSKNQEKYYRYDLSLALMDLCDEADTTNDGKISIEEYLTIAKNYGIKVFITDYFLF